MQPMHAAQQSAAQLATTVATSTTIRSLCGKYQVGSCAVAGLALYGFIKVVENHHKNTAQLLTSYNMKLNYNPATYRDGPLNSLEYIMHKLPVATAVRFITDCMTQLEAFMKASAVDRQYNTLSACNFIAWVGAHIWLTYHYTNFTQDAARLWILKANGLSTLASMVLIYLLQRKSNAILKRAPFGYEYTKHNLELYMQDLDKSHFGSNVHKKIEQQRAKDIAYLYKFNDKFNATHSKQNYLRA